MKHTHSAGGVVLNKKGLVLVVNQHGSSWSLPKGHIDDGEDALTAAKREITEESGITRLVLIRELGSYDRFRIGLDGQETKTELKTITLFLFRTEEENLKPIDPGNPKPSGLKKKE
ncbi:MAG: NUDIX domain-containing protein [Patescibacteria group bacterium]